MSALQGAGLTEEHTMSATEVTSSISSMAVVITARGGTRRQRGAAIAAEVRRWAPERLSKGRTSHDDGALYPGSSVQAHPLTTTIRYARNGSDVVPCSCGVPNRANYHTEIVIGRDVPGGTETSSVDVYTCTDHTDENDPSTMLRIDDPDSWTVLESTTTHLR